MTDNAVHFRPSDVRNFDRFFKRADKNHDGKLTLAELNERKGKIRNHNSEEYKFLDDLTKNNNEKFNRANTDNNDNLSEGEFVQFGLEQKFNVDLKNGTMDEFFKIDANHNGAISKSEFRAYEFNKADTNHDNFISEEELKALDPDAKLSDYNKNGDTKLSKDEFKKYADEQFRKIDTTGAHGRPDNAIVVEEFDASRPVTFTDLMKSDQGGAISALFLIGLGRPDLLQKFLGLTANGQDKGLDIAGPDGKLDYAKLMALINRQSTTGTTGNAVNLASTISAIASAFNPAANISGTASVSAIANALNPAANTTGDASISAVANALNPATSVVGSIDSHGHPASISNSSTLHNHTVAGG